MKLERINKMKKNMLLIIIFILILGLSINTFAVEEDDNNIATEPQNTIDDNTTNNNEINNENNNENNIQQNETAEQNNQEIPNIVQQPEPISNQVTPENEYKAPQIATPKNEEEKSNNANLKSLSLDVEGLSPEFNKSITEYYLLVDLSIEEINVNAIAEDSKSAVTIVGNKNLEEGENSIQITVRAENGNTKTYVIHVTKTDNIELMDARLKSLSIKGFSFYPSFKPNIYNYNLIINEEISKLDISAEVEIEGATFEITGNENLTDGDNLIKVVVIAKDGETKREYKINVFISSEPVQKQETNKKQAFILIGVLGLAITVIGVIVLKQRKYI